MFDHLICGSKMKKMKYLILLISIISTFFGLSQTLLIPQNAEWKYFDQGGLDNEDWTSVSFDMTSWSQGDAQLGYGDGDENTVVSYGGDDNNKHITTYFRKEIVINNPSAFASLHLELLRDDGAVVYLNGQEVWRDNLPVGPILASTQATTSIAWPNEDDWISTSISASYLIQGLNVIAVEIHQRDGQSSDVSFNFKMTANYDLDANVVRGPYLQKGNQNEIVLRWRTDIPTDSRVLYGISPANLNQQVVIPDFTTEHSVKLVGLSPNTIYYYSIGSYSNVYAEGSNLFFETLPEQGKEESYKFVVLGDAGTGYQEQLDTKNAILNYGGNHYDGVILLGDNAYQSGFDSEYQDNFFNNKYNEIFENTIIWPAPGNHDYNNHIPFSPDPAYFNIFDVPTNGECGGYPSNTEKYYSFNYGNIHFISLDSYDVPRASDGVMATWLEQDLQANTLPWIIAYWHHPPYTKGSHDSDNGLLDGELIEMRENLVPILEEHGVDLILNGHSHSYERSVLIDGHYGSAASYAPSIHGVQTNGGTYPTECPYVKKDLRGSHDGAIYCVMGCSGKVSGTSSGWPHPIMHSYNNTDRGAMVLEVEGNRLDATFITSTGILRDKFTVVKGVGKKKEINVCVNEQFVLNSSWDSDTTIWLPMNVTSELLEMSSLTNTTIYATDELGCVTDTFDIILSFDDSCSQTNVSEFQAIDLTVDYLNGNLTITQGTNFYSEFEVYNSVGQIIGEMQVSSNQETKPLTLKSKGTYFLKPKKSHKAVKFIYYD